MNEFKQYKRKNISEMRQVIYGEDLSGVSISDPDRKMMQDLPNVFALGYIARNPKNHEDMWYVAKDYFDDNLELINVKIKIMIQAKELRIGNLIKYDDGTIVMVNTISGSDIGVRRFPQSLSIHVLLPIELTPEILEKCGFKIVVELHPTYLIGRGAIVLHVTKQSGDYWHCIVYNNYEDELSERHAGVGIIKYLHQLQNLYFVLTGEELNVQLS